ncbi:hypothetical protein K492DRAFT_173333 [Lichtheimia hyalospora FSU 10163]|nr:hypothetical protein K492DRAFT_173333 [Lichtheimia hyalospora FSU 10163]
MILEPLWLMNVGAPLASSAFQSLYPLTVAGLMGDATFPSALAPSASVPNAITLRGLIY